VLSLSKHTSRCFYSAGAGPVFSTQYRKGDLNEKVSGREPSKTTARIVKVGQEQAVSPVELSNRRQEDYLY